MRAIYLIITGGTMEKVYCEQSGTVLNRISKIERYFEVASLAGLGRAGNLADE